MGVRLSIVWTGDGIPRREIFQIQQRGGVFSVRTRDGLLASGFVYYQQIRRGESFDVYHVHGGDLHFAAGVQVHAIIEAVFRGGVAVAANT